MRNDSEAAVLQTVETLFRLGTTSCLTDADLLDRFISSEGERASAAFEVIVDRHGPMVFDVCRNALRDLHEAEDAFQATFLILAMQARSIRKRSSVASWLFGVASRVAARARSEAARRRSLQRKLADHAEAHSRPDDGLSLLEALHEAIASLPEKYRDPIVLCDLEGLTYQAAAERLGCPVGTVSVRLMRARARVRDRLLRDGAIAITSTCFTCEPSAEDEARRISPALITATARYATGLYSRSGPGLNSVSIHVASLMEGVIRTMFFKQVTTFAAVPLVSCLFLVGVGITGYRVWGSGLQQAPAGGHQNGESARSSREEPAPKHSLTADQPKKDVAVEPLNPQADPVKRGAIAQIEVARNAIRALEQIKDRGEAVSEHEYGEWSLRLMQAKRDFAGTKAAEIEALEAHAARMKASTERAIQLVKAGGANMLQYYEAKYRYNEATTWIEKAKAEAAQQGGR